MSLLARLSLANKSLVAMATIAILLLGGFLIPSLKQELFPSLSFPTVSIISVYPGASPSIVERDVTTHIEQGIQGVTGIQKITSYSSEGSSTIQVSFNYGTDLDKASQTLTQRLNSLQRNLPSSVTPQVQTFSITEFPIISLAVTADEPSQDLATDLKQLVVPELQGISGVGNVNVTGVRDQIVTITLDLNKMKAKGVTLNQVQAALQANNISLPAGDVTANDQTVPIKTGNSFTSLDDLKNVQVGTSGGSQVSGGGTAGTGNDQQMPGTSGTDLPGGSIPPTGSTQQSAQTAAEPVVLQDIATVKEDLAPSTSITRTNGKESLGLSIVKTSNGNTVTISNAVRAKIDSLERKLGHKASITIISDQAPSVTQSINDLIREGLIGAAFAIIVILVFLLSLRSTLVTAVSIPLSIVIALISLYIGNYTLNILTLGGLTIAVGRVVDDSIVVLENIYRHIRLGEEKKVAIPAAVREIAGAITSSTLTTVSVFLPIAFVGGMVGQLFTAFAVAVTVALLASLVVALTVIPVLAFWFLKSPSVKGQTTGEIVSVHRDSWLERGYVALLRWVTARWWQRTLVIVLAVFTLFISLGFAGTLKTNLFGSSGSNTYSVSLALPPATSLEKANQAALKVENIIAHVPDLKVYQTTVGSSGIFSALSGGGKNAVSFSITSSDSANQETFLNTLRQRLEDDTSLKDLGTLTVSQSSDGPSSSNIEVDVTASDPQVLATAAQQVKDRVAQISGLTDVASSLSTASPQIEINVDAKKAAHYGTTPAQVAQTIRQIYTGSTVSHIDLNGAQQDVNLYLGTRATTITTIENMLIPVTTGYVKVKDLATVSQVNGPTQINHINSARTASVTATVTDTNVGAVSLNVQQELRTLTLPEGASYSIGGVTADQSSTFSNLGIAILIAIILVYCIMVATFNSLLLPLLLLISIPFATTGSLILLTITNTPLGASAIIGFLMLVGIVVTNAIVLLDLVQQYRKKGLDARTAVIEGGRRRLRPILMTAIATILALTPMALGFGGSSGFISGPLAIVVIGGLTSSTLLTLVLVPTLYVTTARKRKGVDNSDDADQSTASLLAVEVPTAKEIHL